MVSVREGSLALMGELKKTGIVFSLREQMMTLEDKRGSDYSLSPITSQELPSFSQQFFSFQRKDWRTRTRLPTLAHSDTGKLGKQLLPFEHVCKGVRLQSYAAAHNLGIRGKHIREVEKTSE